MGCFLVCFGGLKDRKNRRSSKRSIPLDLVHQRYWLSRTIVSQKQITPNPLTPNISLLTSASERAEPVSEIAADALPELKENREQVSFKITRKKVTFDLNVKIYEAVIDEDPEDDHQRNKVIDTERKPHEGQYRSSPKLGAFPLNHRYQNCESSDEDGSEYGEDEEEEDDEEDGDFDEEEYNEVGVGVNEEESYDSLFFLAIDEIPRSLREVNSPKPKCPSSPDRQVIPSAGGNARDRSHYVHSVLNPIENLTQWKEIKLRAAPGKNSKKENIVAEQENHMIILSPEPTIKVKKYQGHIKSDHVHNCSTKQEISVDASLSSWLLPSANSIVEKAFASNSHLSNSPFSREERPILGALTIEDIKQASVTSSPGRSHSSSPDEIPILGTVGRYWISKNEGDDSSSSCQPGNESKGIPNTTNKYRG